MGEEFNFKKFVDEAKIKQRTIDALTKEDFDDEESLVLMNQTNIAALDISDGDAGRLQRALDRQFKRSVTQPSGQGTLLTVKTEPGGESKVSDSALLGAEGGVGDGLPGGAFSNPERPTVPAERATTTTLQKDAQ